MGLYHAHGEDLIKVVESEYDNSMVQETINEQPDVVEAQGYALDDIIGMLIYVLQKLLDVWVTTGVEIGIVDVHHNVFEVVLLLLPLQVLLELWQAERFEEHLDAQMLKIVWIKILDRFMREVVGPPL